MENSTDVILEKLKVLAEKAGYPILTIEESVDPEYYPDPETAPDFSGTYHFDTRTFASDDEEIVDTLVWNIRYVGSIIEAALKGYNSATASRKYSFGDTPEWWVNFEPKETSGRETRTIYVDVHY